LDSRLSSKIIFLSVLFLSFYYGNWFRPLFDVDEGAFTEATREMMENGNYIITYLNGKLRFDKPILIYWLQLSCVKMFGLNEFALRLPSAIAASVWAVAVFRFTARHSEYSKGMIAATAMAASVIVSVVGKLAIADALLNMFLTLSMFSMFNYYKFRKKHQLYLTHIFIGLGVLTKGPVAVLIPGAVSIIYFLFKKEYRFWFTSVFNPAGLVLIILIAGPWYWAAYMQEGMNFINGFILRHNVHRFSQPMEKHGGSFLYYLPIIIFGLMPFTWVLLKPLRKISDILFNDLKMYMACWFLFVIIFFSISGTKLPHYVLYGFTPLFVLGGLNSNTKKGHYSPAILSFFLSGFLASIPMILKYIPIKQTDTYTLTMVQSLKSEMTLNITIILGVIALLSLFPLLVKELRKHSIVYCAVLSMISINVIFLPIVSKVLQEPVKQTAIEARTKGYKVYARNFRNPSFNLYYRGITPQKSGNMPKTGDVYFTRLSDLKNFNEDYEILYKNSGYSLIRITNIKNEEK